jgi:hypothetical protein
MVLHDFADPRPDLIGLGVLEDPVWRNWLGEYLLQQPERRGIHAILLSVSQPNHHLA